MPSDEANLMLLSGIIITIAFIMTALTLSQISALERAAVAQAPVSISDEWRFLHERIPANVNVSIAPDTRNDTFTTVTFPAIAETFRSVEAEKGYDLVMRLAGSGSSVSTMESTLEAGGKYTATSMDGRVNYSAVPADPTNDGLLWQAPCPDPSVTGCISGVFVYVHLSDGSASVDETMLVPANQ